MASTPNFEELDDVMFGVSTRHQWNQLISQIEATNYANKNGSRNSKKKSKNVLQEQNGSVFFAVQEQDQKGGTKVCNSYFNPLSLNTYKRILLTVLHTFLMELVRRICLNIKLSYPW